MGNESPASVLTNKQREFLRGEKTPAKPRNVKGRIRDRTEYGLYDFGLLYETLEQKELRKIFGDGYAETIEPHEEAQGEKPEGYPAVGYVPGTIAFLLRGLNFNDEQIYPGLDEQGEQQPAFNAFTDAVEDGVRQYLADEGLSANVDVSIELSDLRAHDELIDGLGDE